MLDLGCAPGSWLQVAAELAGPKGRVVGIDLNPVAHDFGSTVRTIVGDAFTIDPAELVGDRARFNVILSDMAPSTSGDLSDHFRSVELCDRVLELAPSVLKPGGSLCMKVFEGEAYPDLLRRTQALFRGVKGFKPKATRDVSREMYVIATGFKGPGG